MPHPRKVLLAALLFIAASALLWLAAPRLLPAGLTGGPMVQNATRDAVSLVWFTTRPVATQLVIAMDGVSRTIPAANEGTRHRVRLRGLKPGAEYAYEVRVGSRVLSARRFVADKPPEQPYRFVVFGDSGKGTREQFLIARAIDAARPDFVLHTGDLVYPDGAWYRYAERFFQPYAATLARVAFWPSLGNHDVSRPSLGSDYAGIFELPENGPAALPPEGNYWFDYGNARIAVVDSNLDEAALRDFVAPWLAEVLGDPAAAWRFVAFHHPPYTGGPHKPDLRIQSALVPVFDAAGVDLVFCGHNHFYERTRPMRGGAAVDGGPGVVYVTTGGGGGKLYQAAPVESRPPYIAAAFDRLHSYTVVEVAGPTLELKQLDLNGAVVDRFSLTRAPPQ